MLYSWGANSYGQLGLGDRCEQYETPREVTSFPGDVASIDQLIGGGGHSLAVCNDGAVYACGWNSKGQLGLGHVTDVQDFQRVESLRGKRIAFARCGWDFTLVVDDEGNGYGSGSNAFGQLGCGDGGQRTSITHEFLLITSLRNVKQVACGLRHSLFLDGSGRLFGCGSAKKGQLGLGLATANENHKVSAPLEITLPEDRKATQISAGQYFSLVLTSSGEVFGFGENKHGQLGDCRIDGTVHSPLLLPMSPCKITTGWTHSGCLLSDGRIATFGRNNYSQLGRSDGEDCFIADGTQFKDVCSGSEHFLAMAANGELVSWGWNEHGNCGNGETNNVSAPLPIAFSLTDATIVKFSAASAHNFALLRRAL